MGYIPTHLINNVCSRYDNLHIEDQRNQSSCDDCVKKEEGNNEKVDRKHLIVKPWPQTFRPQTP